VRTPLVRLPDTDLWLKLETLQPIGSFKIRGATNAIRRAGGDAVAGGVVTASAGNMAQGVAWAAREAGVPATIVVPEHAPETKVAAIERLGGRVLKVPFPDWWRAIEESRYEGVDGLFVHPVQDDLVMAGNGTIGLELLEDLPGLAAVVVPFGGGGLVAGIASAVKARKPDVRVYAVEPETAAPLSRSFAAGAPQEIDYTPSFVDGAGGRLVLPRMWPIVAPLVDGALVATLDETAGAVRLLAERVRVIAEGAGALALAAGLRLQQPAASTPGPVACIVSGGNVDFSVLSRILAGETP
jgi:threonine dehydratase